MFFICNVAHAAGCLPGKRIASILVDPSIGERKTMKKFLGILSTVTLFTALSLTAAADDKKPKTSGSYESKSTNTTTTDTGTTKTNADTVYGKVEEYVPGKSIKITTPGKTEGTKTYDLADKDMVHHVASNVKVGEWVSVTEKTDNHGKKMMTIARSKHAARQQ